jgi:hypothetical protein
VSKLDHQTEGRHFATKKYANFHGNVYFLVYSGLLKVSLLKNEKTKDTLNTVALQKLYHLQIYTSL